MKHKTQKQKKSKIFKKFLLSRNGQNNQTRVSTFSRNCEIVEVADGRLVQNVKELFQVCAQFQKKNKSSEKVEEWKKEMKEKK